MKEIFIKAFGLCVYAWNRNWLIWPLKASVTEIRNLKCVLVIFFSPVKWSFISSWSFSTEFEFIRTFYRISYKVSNFCLDYELLANNPVPLRYLTSCNALCEKRYIVRNLYIIILGGLIERQRQSIAHFLEHLSKCTALVYYPMWEVPPNSKRYKINNSKLYNHNGISMRQITSVISWVIATFSLAYITRFQEFDNSRLHSEQRVRRYKNCFQSGLMIVLFSLVQPFKATAEFYSINL